jgi:hypothetical protein
MDGIRLPVNADIPAPVHSTFTKRMLIPSPAMTIAPSTKYQYKSKHSYLGKVLDDLFVQVYFTDMTYEETKEEFAYDIISLLCDIGGTIGLLLGASG